MRSFWRYKGHFYTDVSSTNSGKTLESYQRWWLRAWHCFGQLSENVPHSLTWFYPIRQYQDFLEDLEEDESLRKNVNIYKGEQLDTADFPLHQHPHWFQPFHICSLKQSIWGFFSQLLLQDEMLVCRNYWLLFVRLTIFCWAFSQFYQSVKDFQTQASIHSLKHTLTDGWLRLPCQVLIKSNNY